jgi:glycosyltransferase involved in cell wall biosynthesis
MISILTATLNAGHHLEDLCRSIECQEVRPLEHIIIDGGSTDNTSYIARQYEQRYKLNFILNPADSGIYSAWNLGLSKVVGDWVFFMGADDTLPDPEVIRDMMVFLENIPSHYRFLVGHILVDGMVKDQSAKKFEKSRLDSFRGILRLPTSGVVYSIELFRSEGKKFDERFRIVSDHYLLSTSDFHKRVCYINRPIMTFGLNGISSCSNRSLEHYIERSKMLAELGLSRPAVFEFYYYCRALFKQILARW